jgi:short-subunit dehydrogenase
MSNLAGRVIWITGASSGIGEGLTYELVKKGAKLILSARRKEELERVKGNCPAVAQPFIRILPLDLSEPSTLKLSVEAALIYLLTTGVSVNEVLQKIQPLM